MKILNIILRYLFSWIDAITAKLITTVYRLLSNLSEIVLYSDEMISVIGKRIGLILGIFMLFRLAISLVNYMISPDKIKDGKQGGGKLIINVSVSLALLISINFIFKEAYRIQGVIVNSKVIEKVFFGNSGIIQSTNDNEEDTVKMDIGYYLYTGFIYPNKEVFGDTCDDLWDVRFDITKKETGQTKTCDELLQDKLPDDARRSIYKARNTLDMSYVFFEYDLISSSGNLSDVLDFDYTPIISNAAGIIVLLVLISFSMDLATRAVKLLFLQIIAPIPILSYMDTGKGQDIFKKWGKECINTYLSVFIRLIAINFAVFMIVLLRGNYKNVFVNNIWLNIFLIIGCLMFAKQVPKLIEEFLGIKLEGMALKPLKKFQEQALFGKQITGLAGAGVAAGAMFGANTIANKGNILSGLAGAGSALARGTVGALKGQSFSQVYKGAYSGAITARNNRDSRQKLGISAPEVWLNSFQRKIGMDTAYDTKDAEIKVAESFSKSSESNVSISEAEIDKNASKIMLNGLIDGNGNVVTGAVTYTDSSGTHTNQYTTLADLREASRDMNLSPEGRAAADAEYQRLRGDVAGHLRREINSGNYVENNGKFVFTSGGTGFTGIDSFDKSAVENVKNNTDNMVDIYSKNSRKEVFKKTSLSDIKAGKKVHKTVTEISNHIQNSGEFRKAQKIQEQTNREKK